MTTFVITYDLIKLKDYPKLWEELERLSAHRALKSFWLVNVPNTAKELHDHLKTYIDADDRLWVSELTKLHWFSNVKAGTNEWLETPRLDSRWERPIRKPVYSELDSKQPSDQR